MSSVLDLTKQHPGILDVTLNVNINSKLTKL